MEKLIPKHGGYRKLKSFQLAQLIYDVTVRFCDHYIDKFSRTRDQMVQAAGAFGRKEHRRDLRQRRFDAIGSGVPSAGASGGAAGYRL